YIYDRRTLHTLTRFTELVSRTSSLCATLTPSARSQSEEDSLADRRQRYKDSYFAIESAGFRPRCSSSASTLGSRPRKFLYKVAASAVPPRDRIIERNRSPFARVSPPCSRNHANASSSSTSLHVYA